MKNPAATSSCGVDGSDPVLTVTEVAVDLRCSKAHVYNVIKGKVDGVRPLPVIRMGRRTLVRRSSLELWKRAVETGLTDVNLPALPGTNAARRMEGVLNA